MESLRGRVSQLSSLERVITTFRNREPDRVPVGTLVGGAALDERIAARVGADGYAASAVTVSEKVRRLLAGRR
jgi:methanogenic corrinoid protein MtbC1